MAAVSVSVRDARSAPADRLWIQSVYRDYLDDLNPGTGIFPALGEVGHREPDQIAHWFGDPNTFPLIIVKGNEPVGFARVMRAVASAAQPRIDYRMAEFFIDVTGANGTGPFGEPNSPPEIVFRNWVKLRQVKREGANFRMHYP